MGAIAFSATSVPCRERVQRPSASLPMYYNLRARLRLCHMGMGTTCRSAFALMARLRPVPHSVRAMGATAALATSSCAVGLNALGATTAFAATVLRRERVWRLSAALIESWEHGSGSCHGEFAK
eukprot:gene16878-biopygen13184